MNTKVTSFFFFLVVLVSIFSCSSEKKEQEYFILNRGMGVFFLKQTEKSLLEMPNVSMSKKGDYKYYFYIEGNDTLYYTKIRNSIKNPIVDNVITTSNKLMTPNKVKVGISVKSLRKLYGEDFYKQIKFQNQSKKDLNNIAEQTGSTPIQYQHHYWVPEYSEPGIRGLKTLRLSLLEVQDSIGNVKDTLVSKITLDYR